MRIGPWILAAGLALLGAGIVSSGSGTWKSDEKPQSTTLDLAGADAIDVGETRIDVIVLGNQGNAMLTYSHGEWAGGEVEPKVSWKHEGNVLKLEGKLEYGMVKDVSLRVPARIDRLAGRRLNVEAEAGVGSLRIESSNLTWKGAADALNVSIMPLRSSDCSDDMHVPAATFEFKEGAVASIRVSIERGSVELGDLSKVGQVELHAGDDVRLHVRRISELDKVRVMPFDGIPTTDEHADIGHDDSDPARAAARATGCAAATVG